MWYGCVHACTACEPACMRVHACMHMCMHVSVFCALNLKNMCISRMHKHSGPVRVRHSKYPLLLLLSL